MVEAVGIIPAAGKGTRFLPFRYPKELFPIGYKNLDNGDIQLKVVCQYSLECLSDAAIENAYVIISDYKFEVVRFLSDGRDYGINLAYLHQREVNGLPFAIDCAYRWVRDKISVLVLPDTIVKPRNSVQQILNFLTRSRADIVLGIFPT